MRFKKGSMVEVMNKEVPASWCLAEIVSGDGHAFDVRYDGYQGVEKVSRRFLRPCPPVISSRRWVSGDIVEVFDENSWKVATVLKELKGGRFLVRLHGFTHEIRVQKTNVRERQSWIDGQWIPVGKISGSYGVEPDYSMKMGTQVPVAAGLRIFQEEDGCLPVYNDARFQESRVVSKKLKRSSSLCSSLIGAKRFKPAEQDGSERHVSGHLYEKSHIGGIHLLLPKVKTRFWFCCLSLGKSSGTFQHHCATDKTICCHWHLSEQLKDTGGFQPPLSSFNVIS